MTTNEKITEIRKKMAEVGADVYIITSSDYHGSEYVCDYFKLREFVSGFDGSNGTLIISKNESALYTDGRYFVQAKHQLEGSEIKLMKMGEPDCPPLGKYIASLVKDIPHPNIGFDGRTMTVKQVNDLATNFKTKPNFGINANFAEVIWRDRPSIVTNKIWKLEDKYAGLSVEEKLSYVYKMMDMANATHLLLTSLDDIAWLFNYRGSDIAYTPVALAYALITKDWAKLYLNKKCISQSGDLLKELSAKSVYATDYSSVYADLAALTGSDILMYDPSRVSVALSAVVPKNVKVVYKANPTTLLKAAKNNVEANNEIVAHLYDAVALTKMIYRIKQYAKNVNENGELVRAGSNTPITEMDIARELRGLRAGSSSFIDESFAPIIASGSNGAIVHYEPTDDNCSAIKNNTFLLMDTGAHYYEGTTDVTRTVLIGEPTEKMKRLYTRVLQGNLELGAAVFKHGTTGQNLDYLARHNLWEEGYDYNHGTGHGVGYLLCVHEGPNAIRLKNADIALAPGMITSNEPGVYIEDEFGVRLENLMLTVQVKKANAGVINCFKTLTVVPFDREAIDVTILDERQKALLNSYNKNVYDILSKYLTEAEKEWLYNETKPL